MKAILALIFGMLSALVISELVLQLLDIPSRPVSGWLSCSIKNPGQCNSLGFRGRNIVYSEDDFVVVLMGDSEVYALSTPFEEMPERRLQHYLKKYRKNVKVFSIADMGYGQDQQYLALKEYLTNYRADLVLLMFNDKNDVANNMFPTAGSNLTIKPTYWLEGDKLRGPTENWMEPVGPRLKLVLLWGTQFGRTVGELRKASWEKNILPPVYQPLIKYQGDVDYTWQHDWDRGKLEDIEIAVNELSGIGELSPRSARIQNGIELTRKLLYEIKKLVEFNNGKFAIFNEDRPENINSKDNIQVHVLNGKYYKVSRKQARENLDDIYRNLEYYRIPLLMDNYQISPDNTHLNRQARDYVFEKLTLILNEKGYFASNMRMEHR